MLGPQHSPWAHSNISNADPAQIPSMSSEAKKPVLEPFPFKPLPGAGTEVEAKGGFMSTFKDHPFLCTGAILVGVGLSFRIATKKPPPIGAKLPGGIKIPGRKFYDGGFEAKMTRREASLILGCRDGAPKERLNERYRTMMKLNHPDRGGSPHLAGKVNQAKEILSASSSS